MALEFQGPGGFVNTVVTRLTFEPQLTLLQDLLLRLNPEWLRSVAHTLEYYPPRLPTVEQLVANFQRRYYLAWVESPPPTRLVLGDSFRLFVRLNNLEMAQYLQRKADPAPLLQKVERELILDDGTGESRYLEETIEEVRPLPYEELIYGHLRSLEPTMISYLLELTSRYRRWHYLGLLEWLVNEALRQQNAELFVEAASRLAQEPDFERWSIFTLPALQTGNLEAMLGLLEIQLDQPGFDYYWYYQWPMSTGDLELLEMVDQLMYQMDVPVDYAMLKERVGQIKPEVQAWLEARLLVNT